MEGDDESLFEISNAAAAANGQLSFKNAPDFENPADADMDNVYMVTVKVTDNGVANKNKMSATRDVMITVTNANEDGSVTFSSVQPKVGSAIHRHPNRSLTAMTTDVKWEWWRSNSRERYRTLSPNSPKEIMLLLMGPLVIRKSDDR